MREYGFKDMVDFVVSLSSFLVIIGGVVKLFKDFFMEIVKFKYRNIPCKLSVFEVLIKLGMACVILFDIVAILVQIFNLVVNRGSAGFLVNDGEGLLWIIGFIGAIVWLINIGVLFWELSNIYDKFISYLENSTKKEVNKLDFWRISIVIFLSSIYILMWTYVIFELDIKSIIGLSSLGISTVISGIIAISLLEVYKTLKNREKYILYTDKELIACNMFLEYNNYYLIFEDGIERFIKKDEVKEIRKIDVDKIQHDKIKNSIKEIINGLIENTNRNLES